MAKYNLKRIDLYVPQYDTDATIRIDEKHASKTPHLVVEYDKVPPHGNEQFAVAIPADWTDRDLAELISHPGKSGGDRNWPAWEIPSNDYASFSLFRFWKSEKPTKD